MQPIDEHEGDSIDQDSSSNIDDLGDPCNDMKTKYRFCPVDLFQCGQFACRLCEDSRVY